MSTLYSLLGRGVPKKLSSRSDTSLACLEGEPGVGGTLSLLDFAGLRGGKTTVCGSILGSPLDCLFISNLGASLDSLFGSTFGSGDAFVLGSSKNLDIRFMFSFLGEDCWVETSSGFSAMADFVGEGVRRKVPKGVIFAGFVWTAGGDGDLCGTDGASGSLGDMLSRGFRGEGLLLAAAFAATCAWID